MSFPRQKPLRRFTFGGDEATTRRSALTRVGDARIRSNAASGRLPSTTTAPPSGHPEDVNMQFTSGARIPSVDDSRLRRSATAPTSPLMSSTATYLSVLPDRVRWTQLTSIPRAATISRSSSPSVSDPTEASIMTSTPDLRSSRATFRATPPGLRTIDPGTSSPEPTTVAVFPMMSQCMDPMHKTELAIQPK